MELERSRLRYRPFHGNSEVHVKVKKSNQTEKGGKPQFNLKSLKEDNIRRNYAYAVNTNLGVKINKVNQSRVKILGFADDSLDNALTTFRPIANKANIIGLQIKNHKSKILELLQMLNILETQYSYCTRKKEAFRT